MLKQVKNKILALKKVAGIELTFLTESSFTINCIILEVKKGNAVVAKTYYNLKTFSELEGKIPEQTPVALVVNGKGLIHKAIDTISNNLPSHILPGVNPNDFIFQYFEGFEKPDIAIIRKNTVEKVIAELTQLKIYCTSLSLAFYDISSITAFINHTGDIYTTQYTLGFNDNRIFQYKINSIGEKEILVRPEINIATAYVKSNFIIPYAAAIKLLSAGIKNSSAVQLESLTENQKRLTQSSEIKLYSFSFLGILLFLLLLNFFIYSHYFSKNNALLSNNHYSLQQKSKYESLKKSLYDKKEFLANAGWLNNSRMISFYADRIAATVPDSVTLTSLNVYPAISKFSFSKKQWNFQQDTILITGLCSDPSYLDPWIKEMGEIQNVNQARINSYQFKKRGETGIFTAEVIIK